MADEGVDLIVTSGGLGPTADDMTVEVVGRFCGRELVLDQELDDKIAEILKPLMARFGYWDFDAVRAANRKQAMIPAGSQVIDPVEPAGRRRARAADGRCAGQAAARAPADVADGLGNRSRAGSDRRPCGLPAGGRADVRAARVGVG